MEEEIHIFLSNSLREAEEAFKYSPKDVSKQCHYLTIKGAMLTWRFGKERCMGYLMDAITAFRKASQLTPDDDPKTLHRLNNVTRSLTSLFHETGNRNTLEKTVHIANHLFTGNNDDRIEAHPVAGIAVEIQRVWAIGGTWREQ